MLHSWSALSLFTMYYICRLFLALFCPSGISVVTSYQWVGEQFASRTLQAQNGFTKLPSALAFRLANTLMGIPDNWLSFLGGCNIVFFGVMLLILLSDDAPRQHFFTDWHTTVCQFKRELVTALGLSASTRVHLQKAYENWSAGIFKVAAKGAGQDQQHWLATKD